MSVSIFEIFSKSPFSPLKQQIEKIKECVVKTAEMVDLLIAGADHSVLEEYANEVSKLEHEVDIIKNELRNGISTTIFLPFNKQTILSVLASQDSIADTAEDFAALLTLKELKIPEEFKPLLAEFKGKVMETFEQLYNIVCEMDVAFESAFGGPEVKHIFEMIDSLGEKEHECDIVQRKLAKKVFEIEDKLKCSEIFLWPKIFNKFGDIANLSEKVGNRIRMMISK